MAFISIEEQETIIRIPRDESCAYVSTTDSTMKTKLDNLCESNPEMYILLRTDGEYENFYKILDKGMISFRKKKREITEEQKQAASERFKQLHAEGKITRSKKTDKKE